MDEHFHKEEEKVVAEAPQVVNGGVGPTSYQFLHSIVTDGATGAMSHFELFKKRQRLDAFLTASPEQLKGMQIEVAEFLQVMKFCEAQYFQVLNEMEQRLSDVERLVPFITDELNSHPPCKFLKVKVAQCREDMPILREDVVSNGECMAKWVRNTPGPVFKWGRHSRFSSVFSGT